MELVAYTKETKAGAAEVDSLAAYLQSEIGTTDLDKLYTPPRGNSDKGVE